MLDEIGELDDILAEWVDAAILRAIVRLARRGEDVHTPEMQRAIARVRAKLDQQTVTVKW